MKLRKKAAVAVAVGAMAAIGVSLVTSPAANADVTAPEPILVSGGPDGNVQNCDEIDPAGDFDLLIDDENGSGGGVTVTLVDAGDGDADLDAIEVEVAAGTTVTAIAVKGGNAYNLYIFNPVVPGPETIVGLVSPDNDSDTPAEVSHYVICGGESEPDPCLEEEANDLYGMAAVARDGEGEPEECVTPTPSTSASASASASSSLPVTGTTLTAGTMTGIIGAGIALIAAGAALVFLRRRRAVAGE